MEWGGAAHDGRVPARSVGEPLLATPCSLVNFNRAASLAALLSASQRLAIHK